MIDPFMLRKRPDQTAYQLNNMMSELSMMRKSVRIMSDDRKNVIIIGNQPVNPDTGKPYSFGIHTYEVKGDRLEEIV